MMKKKRVTALTDWIGKGEKEAPSHQKKGRKEKTEGDKAKIYKNKRYNNNNNSNNIFFCL